MANLQCPNCGGYKTKKWLNFTDALMWSFYVGVASLIIGVVSLMVFLKNPLSFPLVVGGSIGVSVLAFVLLLIYSTTRQNDFVCRICGNRWDKRNFPEGVSVQVKQDLIQKGNILLEQEEAERRRQQQWEEDARRRRQ